jgi:hypothetical protein
MAAMIAELVCVITLQGEPNADSERLSEGLAADVRARRSAGSGRG